MNGYIDVADFIPPIYPSNKTPAMPHELKDEIRAAIAQQTAEFEANGGIIKPIPYGFSQVVADELAAIDKRGKKYGHHNSSTSVDI